MRRLPPIRGTAVFGLSLLVLLACVALIAATGRGAAGAPSSSLEPPSARAEIGDFLLSYDADIDRSGRLVVVGLSHPEGRDPEARQTVVIRHLRNGALDTSFAGNGVATLQPIIGAAVAAGPRKIAVAGPGVDEDVVVARLNLDGSRDRSFGQNGIERPYGPGGVADIAIQGDNRILLGVGGLLRLTPDGAPDRSFGEEGFANIGAGRLALQPDGKIITVGGLPDSGPPDPGPQVIRLNRDGTLDPTFGGGDGLAPFPGRGGLGELGLALQTDGKIVVSGTDASACLGCLELVLGRYTSDGQPDPSFGGGDGLVTASGVAGGPLALQGERIVVQHLTYAADFEIARYTPEGELDPTFGVEGIVRRTRTSLRQPLIIVESLAIQPSGRLLAAGHAHVAFTQYQDAAVQIAFQSSGERDRHFGGGDGIVFTPSLVRCGERFAQIVGSTSANVITDNPSHNAVIAGLGGSDQINAGDGDDLVCGGFGDDEISGESGDDRVLGESGEDLVIGGLDDDQLLGGSGMDRLLGGPGIDRLFGGQGDDFLRGGPGRDRLHGGAGNDVERP